MYQRVKIFTLLLIAVPFILKAQENTIINYGLKAGYVQSSISNLETTILSEPYFLHYTLTSKPRDGWTVGGFVNYRLIDYMALQAEMMYTQQGSDLNFNNIDKDFNYKMQFNYQYFNFRGTAKFYPLTKKDKDENPFWGFNIGLGPQVGFNTSSQKIIYTSGGSGRLPSFGTDLEQQQQIRNVLKGRTNFGFHVGLGWEFRERGLVIDAKYYFGVTDVVETLANSYNFIENKNTNNAFEFTIGWDFSYFNIDHPKHSKN